MIRAAIVTAALLVAGPAFAKEPAAADVAKINAALKAIGCDGGEPEIRKDGFKVEDASCKDGQYDITLDKSFKVVKKHKE
jgi:hypothetical protein